MSEEETMHMQMREVFCEYGGGRSVLDLADAAGEVLAQIYSQKQGRSPNATARAILRGHAEREELKSLEGGHISADEARSFLNLSKPAVLERYKQGKLLGWRDKNAVRFPVWQFAPEGGLIPGMEQVLAALSSTGVYDEWAKVLFFLNRRRSLGGQRPLDLLRRGRLAEVLDLAGVDE